MPDTVYLDNVNEVIRVDSIGAITAQDLFNSLLSMLKLCGTHKISKVLVNATRQTSLPATFELFEFGSRLSPGKIPEDMQFAVVGSKNTTTDQGFLENVVRNRGGEFRQFDTEEQALAWLASV